MNDRPSTDGSRGGDGSNGHTWRLAVIATAVAVVIAVIPEFFRDETGYFGFDGLPAFPAWSAAGTVIALVVIARILAALLRRDEDHYDR